MSCGMNLSAEWVISKVLPEAANFKPLLAR